MVDNQHYILYKCKIFKHLCYFAPHHAVYEHKIFRQQQQQHIINV